MYEVTRGQFRQFVQDSGYQTEAERDERGGFGYVDGQWKQGPRFLWNGNLGFEQTDSHPVVNVSWNDVTAFCEWLSEKEGGTYGLPTEAQWEYTCRAGTTTRWHGTDSEVELQNQAWFADNSDGRTHPIGGKLSNAWGLYDMHGNVWEWCADWRHPAYYANSPLNDPQGPAVGSNRVARGGAWFYPALYCRSAFRSGPPPSYRNDRLGFRVALSLVKSSDE